MNRKSFSGSVYEEQMSEKPLNIGKRCCRKSERWHERIGLLFDPKAWEKAGREWKAGVLADLADGGPA